MQKLQIIAIATYDIIYTNPKNRRSNKYEKIVLNMIGLLL